MQKYTCIICGQEGETRNLGRLYCSKRCNAIAHRRRAQEARVKKFPSMTKDGVCRFNEGVLCSSGNCAGCGWNPDVAKERLRGMHGL